MTDSSRVFSEVPAIGRFRQNVPGDQVPLERVSVLLGHGNIDVTEKHYSPWVRSRQEQLEADVRGAWLRDSLAFAQTRGTPEVHGNPEVLN